MQVRPHLIQWLHPNSASPNPDLRGRVLLRSLLWVSVVPLVFATSACGVRTKVSEMMVAAATTPAQVGLANHLKQSGAKLYGAFWCPYCKRQEALFGDAAKLLPIVECDPNGRNAQPALCNRANISSYPTWEIKGKLYRGILTLEELAALSGYQGSQNFRK